MLTKIKSTIFVDGTIDFHDGLNVVLGDNIGSNSIGKSTLLMIIDFIFGGNTYISHNHDVVENLGHHEFGFTLKFNNIEYHFVRGTENPDDVYNSNTKYEKLNKINVNTYTSKLKDLYNMESDLSFRSSVSPFSRVWGKDNYNVKKPLHNFPQEGFANTVTKLIKLFNKYDSIEMQDKELKDLEKQRKIIRDASKHEIIPKMTKKKFEDNLKEIESLTKDVERIGKSVYTPSGDIDEIISEEMITLREKKKKLIEEKEYYISRLNRTTRTIKKSANAGFESLLEFFPNVNLEKLQKIESFHRDISSILADELEDAKKELSNKILELDKEINITIEKQQQLLNPDDEINVFIDNLIEISSKLKNLQLENNYYEKISGLNKDIKTNKDNLKELKETIVQGINKDVNKKLKDINDLIHLDKRTSPKLNLTVSKYEYEVFDNTGTGKAFTNLIMFDLAIISLTKLPFIMHDSFLFKNIEKEVVEQIIEFYSSLQSKQIFIAIDIIDIYSKETQKLLNDQKVIQLTKDKLLTSLDWRDKGKTDIE